MYGLSISFFITPYKSISKIDKINSINNNDSLFSYLLSSVVINHKCIHIMLPVINIDTDFQQIIEVIKPYEEVYNDYTTMIENNTISNIFSIRTKEYFFKCMLLKEFVKTQKFDLKKLLFQVIHTLYLYSYYKFFFVHLIYMVNLALLLKVVV